MTEQFNKKVIGDCTLYNADCVDVLSSISSVDAVVTDPPYGLEDWNNRGSNKKRPFDSNKTALWDKPLDKKIISMMQEISKYQIFWGANYYLDFLKRTKQMFIWNKNIRNMHFNDCEIAWCSGWKEASRVFDFSPQGLKKVHPTQKPLQLMKWCIDKLPKNAETILDPFMGSGTTGVACAKLGKKFIGVELDPEYFQIACQRIEKAYQEPDLFVSPPTEIKQEVMEL